MATRTRKAPAAEIAAAIDIVDDALADLDTETADAITDAMPPKGRKYMSHENCGHARKGEAGKVARATCRRAHRVWFAAEIEFYASDAGVAYLATGVTPYVFVAA